MTGTTTAPGPQAAAPDDDAFARHMAEMQAHYSPGGAGTIGTAPAYRLPASVLALAAPPAAMQVRSLALAAGGHTLAAPVVAHPLQPVAGPAMLVAQRSLLAFIQSRHQDVTTALAAVVQPGQVPGFELQMSMIEARDQAAARARIGAMYTALIAAGLGHPQLRPQILVTSNHAGGFLASVAAGARDAVAAATRTLHAAPHAIGTAVHDAGAAVGHWAEEASHSVGKFFGSLF